MPKLNIENFQKLSIFIEELSNDALKISSYLDLKAEFHDTDTQVCCS